MKISRWGAAAATLGLVACTLALASPAQAQQDLDCDDFDTQAEANAHLGPDGADPHRLDGDGDGIACESLPPGSPPDGNDPDPDPTEDQDQEKPSPTPAGDPSCELVDQLDVAEEDRSGYDRELFGDYDRDALLNASFDEHGGYYSVWDDTLYDDPSDVDVDHTVALAEAWDSGAHSWDAATLDQFGGDEANLTLLTDEVNQGSKSDGDFAEWVPPVGSLVDDYLAAYVGVKATYDLSVDPVERDALLAAATEHGLCEASGSGNGSDNEDTEGEAGGLPVTGSSTTLIAGGAVALLAVGGGLFLVARRRRVSFTA